MANPCHDCEVSMLCLAGKLPKRWPKGQWKPIWQCQMCGLTHWIKEYRYTKKMREKRRTQICPVSFTHLNLQSICTKCYMKRELAEDKACEERIRTGEVEPRDGTWGGP